MFKWDPKSEVCSLSHARWLKHLIHLVIHRFKAGMQMTNGQVERSPRGFSSKIVMKIRRWTCSRRTHFYGTIDEWHFFRLQTELAATSGYRPKRLLAHQHLLNLNLLHIAGQMSAGMVMPSSRLCSLPPQSTRKHHLAAACSWRMQMHTP